MDLVFRKDPGVMLQPGTERELPAVSLALIPVPTGPLHTTLLASDLRFSHIKPHT